MKKLAVLALTVMPMAAMAHPEHGETAYSLAHYFTGSHLLMGIVAAVVVFAAVRVGRRLTR